jgi:hypothetical protein
LIDLSGEQIAKCLEEQTMSNQEYLAAGNHATSREDLLVLALSKEAKVRGRVAENPSCPTVALRVLAEDEHPDVRSNVAANPKATFAMLRQLAKDFCLNVRYTLAEDHSLPHPLLKMLSRDDNPYVSERAKQTMDRLKEERSRRKAAGLQSRQAS